MKSFKLPLSIWAYIAMIIVLGIFGHFINLITAKSKK